MEFAKKLKNPFIQQYLIEIVFPLIGYFFFDWNILIIGVYYLIDHLASQILFFRRAHWVNVKGKQPVNKWFLLLFVLFFLICFLAETLGLGYFIMETQEQDSDQVLAAFYVFAKAELWLLFPVVLLVYHLKDQFTFYMPRRYLNYDFKKMMLYDIINSVAILFLFFLGGFFWMKFGLNDFLIILIFIVLKITFDLTIRKFFVKMSGSAFQK